MPALADYGLVQHSSSKYPPRTAANIKDSDVTILITESLAMLDGGSSLTAVLCTKIKRPIFIISRHGMRMDPLAKTVDWLEFQSVEKMTVNIAGNRESKSPGIEEEALDFLTHLFRRMK